jgi:hypothetical protein
MSGEQAKGRVWQSKNNNTQAANPPTKERQPDDVYMFTEPEEGSNEESKLLCGFKIRGGIGKNSGKPYLFMSGYSKEFGRVNINLITKNEPQKKLIEALAAAGLIG